MKYLNSRPLICAYDGPVIFEHPSELARRLATGELDLALVPVFEALRTPGYSIADGVAVGCDGPVFSVILAYRGELGDVRRVGLDPASLTSANLLRVILAEFHGLRPEFGSEGDARLIIGNQAIDFRMNEESRDGWTVLDLGAEWKRCTGLPFVFAVWAMRPQVGRGAAEALRGLKREGVARIPELIRTEAFGTEDVREEYLTRCIRYEVGVAEREAIAVFRALLAAHGLLPPGGEPLCFV